MKAGLAHAFLEALTRRADTKKRWKELVCIVNWHAPRERVAAS